MSGEDNSRVEDTAELGIAREESLTTASIKSSGCYRQGSKCRAGSKGMYIMW